MSTRKIARKRHHWQNKGFMVVHHRWIPTEGRTPQRWLDWRARHPSL